MTKKKILICGATGFIGRNILNSFVKKKNYEIHATCHTRNPLKIDRVIWHRVNLLEKDSVDKLFKSKDIIIQCAATTSGMMDIIKKPHVHITDNAVMNSLLLRASFDHKVKHFVFFSCSLMYHNSEIPLKEVDFDLSKEINPKYFAGAWNKLYFEKMCKFFSTIGSTKYTVIRHSNIYGPFDKYDLDRSHVFGATITKVFNSEKKIIVWGKGEEKKDLLYVSDLVEFVNLAIKNQKEIFELMNCGFGKAIRIKELVTKIIKHSGKNLDVEYDEQRPTVYSSLSLNSNYALEKIGWKPKTDIDIGIKKTINWYIKNYL